MRTKIAIAGLSALALLALACGSGGDVAGPGAQGSDDDGGKKTRKIVMEVSGPKSADVTYGLGSDQSQANGAKLPWKKEMTSTETMLITSLVAQSKGSGTITCKITIDGKVVKTNKSSGEYAVVTCTADDL